jgi:hypothetical protein
LQGAKDQGGEKLRTSYYTDENGWTNLMDTFLLVLLLEHILADSCENYYGWLDAERTSDSSDYRYYELQLESLNQIGTAQNVTD